MSKIQSCELSIFVFALLMLVGGIIGFKKSKSKASLIAGLLSFSALGYCGLLSQSNPLLAFKMAFIITGALDGIFLVRLMKTKKFMPSGMLLVLSLIEQAILYWTMAI